MVMDGFLKPLESTRSCSIVIPTHNRPDLLCRAVRSALAACPDDGEIIVVDDRCEPPAMQTLQDLMNADTRLNVLRNPGGGGVADTRNFGCTQARGEVLFFLDDDDELMPDYCARVLQVVRQNVQATWGYSSALLRVDHVENQQEPLDGRRMKTGLVSSCRRTKYFVAGAGEGFWIKRSTWGSLTGFDITLSVDEDTDLCMQLMARNDRPWYESQPGVRLYRGYAQTLGRKAQLTQSTSSIITARCSQKVCEKYVSFYPAFSSQRWYLCERYIRRAVKAGLADEAMEFAQKQRPWLWSMTLMTLIFVKNTKRFISSSI